MKLPSFSLGLQLGDLIYGQLPRIEKDPIAAHRLVMRAREMISDYLDCREVADLDSDLRAAEENYQQQIDQAGRKGGADGA